jgi:hypothetical protein
MRRETMMMTLGAALLLGGCGGSKDALADQVEKRADNTADAMEAESRGIANDRAAGVIRNQADMVRSAGRDQAQAIREAPLKANDLSQKEKDGIVNARVPEPGRDRGR